jgi:hypothetical protein
MKRFLVAVAVVAFAGTALADHKVWSAEPNYTFSVGGRIRIDYFYQDQFPYVKDGLLNFLTTPGASPNFTGFGHRSAINQDTRVAFKGSWGDVVGEIRLAYRYDWDHANQNKKDWIAPLSLGTGSKSDRALDVAWLQFPVPYTPLKVKAGLQDIVFGQGIVLNDTFYAALVTLPLDKMSFTVGQLKVHESYTLNNDNDIYAAIFSTSAIPANTLSAIFLYGNFRDVNIDHTLSGTADVISAKPWIIGANLTGSAGMINYWLEGYYEDGTAGPGLDLQAFGLAGSLGATVGMADLSIWGAYGSGPDDSGSTYKGFLAVSPDWEPDFIMIYWLNGYSISNLEVLALKAAVKDIVPNFSAWAQVGFYNAAKDTRVDGEKYLGTEFDISGTYKINDYLKWTLNVGYLVSGDGLSADFNKNPFQVWNRFDVTF